MPLQKKTERNNTLDIIGDPFYGERNEVRLKVLVHNYPGRQLTINMSAESFYKICPEGKRVLKTNGQMTQQDRTGIEYIPKIMHKYIKSKIAYHKNKEDRIIGFLNEGRDSD